MPCRTWKRPRFSGGPGKKKKEEGDGAIGKVYSFTDEEKDRWANLFDYMGSHET